MNQIQWATIAVLVVVFAPIALTTVLFLLHRNRRKLDAKELAIECREQLFSMLVRNADDIYVMFSPEGFAVEYVSPNVEKLLGVSPDAVKRDIRVLSESAVDPSGDPGTEAIASLEEGGCLQMYRERIRPTTGEVRWYQETLYRESIKGVDKYVLVLSDRTEERKSSLLLEQALDIARSSNEAKSQFLANMSHDIRTPINAIVGMTKIARESGEASEKITSCLDAITVSSRHLLELINDVLDMSRIESGQLELQERRFDLDDVVAEVEAIIRPQAQAKGQDLHVDCSGVEHKVFAGDELRISQILLNLASNAVKYTQEGGSISFVVSELEKTRSSYARLVFAILDNGMGMSPEFVERIFDPFERSEEASISRIQGTGLGMSITKALIDAMGGVVEVDSEVGSGSAFRVTLELRLASPKETRPPLDDAPAVAPYDFEGKRFLLAEDNELNAEIMIELLGHRGAEVEWAENGEAACDAFARRPVGYYDAVLMDVMMPIMNGYEAARAIRACAGTCAADVKIIALTANAFAEDVKTALDAGMDAHVAKPVDIDGLAGVLGRICG
ncbi:response regulator [Eggerthella guodeyinii]|uniref:Circadian input-output histidine kinase CikA n=3 Tax=Eggerthella TaxID=84111 RepID=A0A6L7IPA6_9ACTN|nr:response regulator [Eggerthella hominis]QOS70099.1 response regulator [Eggerthella guodeyinii]